MGMVFVAMAEYGWLTTQGLSIQLSQRAVANQTTALVHVQFHRWAPSLRHQIESQLQPAIEAQITTVLQHLAVSVDGVNFGIPTAAQLRLRQRLIQTADQQLDRYVQSQLTPSKIVKQIFQPGLSPHWFFFKLRIQGVVIPLRIHLK